MKQKRIIFWVISTLPLCTATALYAFFPTMIPLHWDISGMVDNWAPKFPSVFLLPLTVLLCSSITALLPYFGDSSDKNPGILYTVLIYGVAGLGCLLSLSFLFLTLLNSF